MPVPLDARANPRLSIVAPCYNEEAGLEEFHRRMTAAAQDTAGADYELDPVERRLERSDLGDHGRAGAARSASWWRSIFPAAMVISWRSRPASTPAAATAS